MKFPLTDFGKKIALWFIVGLIVAVVAWWGFGKINKLRTLANYKSVQEKYEQQMEVRDVYIPKTLEKKTTNDLCNMGANLGE